MITWKQLITILLTGVTFLLFAQQPPVENTKAFSYVSPDDEVSVNIARGTGEVKLTLLVKNLAQYDHIEIERSAENPNYFSRCKYLMCKDYKAAQVIETIDRYPYPASKDVYYRIKTVTKDGVERAYPPIGLPAIGSQVMLDVKQ